MMNIFTRNYCVSGSVDTYAYEGEESGGEPDERVSRWADHPEREDFEVYVTCSVMSDRGEVLNQAVQKAFGAGCEEIANEGTDDAFIIGDEVYDAHIIWELD